MTGWKRDLIPYVLACVALAWLVGCAPICDTEHRLVSLERDVKTLQPVAELSWPEEPGAKKWGCAEWERYALVWIDEEGVPHVYWQADAEETRRWMIQQLVSHYSPGDWMEIMWPVGPYWVPTVPGEPGERIDKSDTVFRVNNLIMREDPSRPDHTWPGPVDAEDDE